MVAELLKKYLWLIQTLIRAGDRGVSFEELQGKWRERFDGDYPRRTFNNHRQCIAEIFNIDIECNRADNTYFIRYADDVTDENAATAWLINTFTVNSMLSLGKERLSGRISVDDIPSGHRYLTPIMDSMLRGDVLKVGYRKYVATQESFYTLRPYALKESSKRWYLVAWCEERQSVRVYGLDRITGLEVTGRQFDMPKDFDVDALFSSCFGVFLDQSSPPCEIRLRATPKEARYLRDLPLHPSQKELLQDDNGVVFSIFVRPNASLFMEILKYGPGVEVLTPSAIRDEIASRLRSALKPYGGDSGVEAPAKGPEHE